MDKTLAAFLQVNKANDRLHFVNGGNKPLISGCIFFPTPSRFKNGMDGIFNLGNPFDRPAPENLWFLEVSSAPTLSKYTSLYVSSGGKPNLNWKCLLVSLDCRESESIYPPVEFNVDLLLNGVVYVLSSFLRQL